MKPHMYPQPEDPDQYLHPPMPQSEAPAQDADTPETSSDNGDVRARLVRRFEIWLDEVLVDENAPPGAAQDLLERLHADEDAAQASDASDLYSLYAELTALTEQTQAQGRSVKQLHEGISQLHSGVSDLHNDVSKLQSGLNPVQPLVESVESLLQRDDQILEQQLEQERQSSQQDTIKTTLDVLIELRDRLTRARDAAQPPAERPRPTGRTGLLARFRPGPASPAPASDTGLIRELELGVNRIDEALQHWNVRPIPCMGQAFDPQTMQVVERVDVTDAADNIVLEVSRTGYWWDEKVYRVAQVKVAGNQADPGTSDEPRKADE